MPTLPTLCQCFLSPAVLALSIHPSCVLRIRLLGRRVVCPFRLRVPQGEELRDIALSLPLQSLGEACHIAKLPKYH